MNDNISQVEQRVNRYWYTDGLGELIGGSMFVLLGLYFALQDFLGEDSMLTGILQASLALLLIGGAAASRRVINSLKARITYPRTGYVEYKVNQKGRLSKPVMVILLAMAVSALTVAFVRLFHSFNSIVAVTGFIVAMVLLLLRAKSTGLTRFYILAAISFLLGVFLSTIELSEGYSLGLYYALMGVCFLVSGAWILQHYLKVNPLPADDQNG